MTRAAADKGEVDEGEDDEADSPAPADVAATASARTGGQDGQRIDKWLWFTRAVKSRTMAATLVSGGKVRVNRAKVEKPSHWLRAGDVVTLAMGRRVRVLKVVKPGARRGPATEAATLYEDLTPAPQPHGQAVAATADAARPQREAGTGRPTKRDRRLIDRLRERDS